MIRTMKSIRIEVDETLHKHLKRESLEQDRSMSDIAREAIISTLKGASPSESRSTIKVDDLPMQPEAKEKILKDNGIKVPAEVSAVFKQGISWCKNGHQIPEGMTKCLVPGCKYSTYGGRA